MPAWIHPLPRWVPARAQQRKPADSADELALVEACRPEIDARFRQFSILANNSLRGVKDVATKPNNATIVAACTQRIRSLAGYVEADAQIAINGRKHAHADVVAIYRQCLDARAAVARLRAQLAEALGTVEATEVARLEADSALKGWVRAEFGVASTQAIDFGFPPPRKGARTVEEKALAVARTKATRKARRTMGKRQKEEIRGSVAVSGAAGAGAQAGAMVDSDLPRDAGDGGNS
jgi:hypothetical protein